jgi:hypothetical protein
MGTMDRPPHLLIWQLDILSGGSWLYRHTTDTGYYNPGWRKWMEKDESGNVVMRRLSEKPLIPMKDTFLQHALYIGFW